MSKNELARTSCGPGMARRNFLRKSALLALPATLPGLAGPVMAAVTTSSYTLPSLQRGSTVTSVRSHGAMGNGATDDTAAFQRAINALPSTGGTVDVPAGTYLLDPTSSVRLRSNMHLRLAPGAVLQAKRNSLERAYVLMLFKITNVEISGGRIVGERDAHLGTSGQWGHGIQVLGSTGVIIRDIHVSKCWGDGVCVGGAMVAEGVAPLPSRTVTIANVVSTGNRRHGLTIANAHGVRVYDSEFSSNRGLEFACGIDIEPANGNPASNIHIENCEITFNERNGVEMHEGARSIVVQDCKIQSNTGYGVFSLRVQDVYVARNSIKHNGLAGVAVRTGCVNHQISRNYFYYNSKRFHNSTPTLQATPTSVQGYRYNGHTELASGISDIRITYNYYYDATFLNRFL